MRHLVRRRRRRRPGSRPAGRSPRAAGSRARPGSRSVTARTFANWPGPQQVARGSGTRPARRSCRSSCATARPATRSVPGCGIDRAVGEDQRRAPARRLGPLCSRLADLLREAQILDLADRERDLDRVELRDGREQRLRAHEIADLRGGDRRDAADRRPAPCVHCEVQLRVLERGARGVDLRAVRGARLDRVVELLLADGALGGERRVALDVQLALAERRLRALELALRLIERRLELARVDLEEQIAGLRRRCRPGRPASAGSPGSSGRSARSRSRSSCRPTRCRSRRPSSRPARRRPRAQHPSSPPPSFRRRSRRW